MRHENDHKLCSGKYLDQGNQRLFEHIEGNEENHKTALPGNRFSPECESVAIVVHHFDQSETNEW
jgi:hypothetical protein